MEIYVIDPNIKLAAVYYNGGKPPHLFSIRFDATLYGLKDQLDQIYRQLNHRGWTVYSIDFHRLTQSGVCGPAK